MNYKLSKKFFEKHKISKLSAANIFYFSANDTLPDLFQQFDKISKEKGLHVPDYSNEREVISAMTDPEIIVNYMRKNNAIANRFVMVQKVLEYEDTTMPLVLMRYLTSALDNYIEIAAHCFLKNDVRYTIELRKKYSEIRNPYAKAVACLVFAMRGMDEEIDFLFEEFEKMSKLYPNENYADFPLLGLQLLFERSNER